MPTDAVMFRDCPKLKNALSLFTFERGRSLVYGISGGKDGGGIGCESGNVFTELGGCDEVEGEVLNG